jgi:hypothetical protein
VHHRYVRPLALPVPYEVEAGVSLHQRVCLEFKPNSGLGDGPPWPRTTADNVTVTIAPPATLRRVPPISVGVPCGGELGPSMIAAERGEEATRSTKSLRERRETPPVSVSPSVRAAAVPMVVAAVVPPPVVAPLDAEVVPEVSAAAGEGAAVPAPAPAPLGAPMELEDPETPLDIAAVGVASVGAAVVGAAAVLPAAVAAPHAAVASSSSTGGRDRDVDHAVNFALCDTIRGLGCKLLHVRYNKADGHGVADLELYKRLADKTDTALVLECVFPVTPALGERGVRGVVQQIMSQLDEAQMWNKTSALVILPEYFLAASTTTDYNQQAHEATIAEYHSTAELLYQMVQHTLKAKDKHGRVRLLGGAVSSFTELNRRRPVSTSLHGVTHSISAIVHSADDDAVMKSVDAAPAIADSVAHLFPDREYWMGPAAISIRGNPFGTPAPPRDGGPRRAVGSTDDPRRTGCFGAAYVVGLASKLLDKGLTCLALGDIVGDRGHTSFEVAPPDDLAPLWAQASYHTSRHGRQRAGTVKV